MKGEIMPKNQSGLGLAEVTSAAVGCLNEARTLLFESDSLERSFGSESAEVAFYRVLAKFQQCERHLRRHGRQQDNCRKLAGVLTHVGGSMVSVLGITEINAHAAAFALGEKIAWYLSAIDEKRLERICQRFREWLDKKELDTLEKRIEYESIMADPLPPAVAPKQGEGTGAAPPTGKAGEGEGNAGTESTPAQSAIVSGAAREAVLGQMEPAVRKAYLAFQYAETMNGRRLEDREAHEWLRESGIDPDKGDLGELTDYELPSSFETFRRYVTAARKPLGESKYTRRGGRPRGRSVVRGDEIEYQRGDKE
jgi:hypothetical protein